MVKTLSELTMNRTVIENVFSKEYKANKKLNVQNAFWEKGKWYGVLYENIIELALSRFEWDGLPKTLTNPYYMEKALILNGTALLYNHETDGFQMGVGAYGGQYNHYNDPTAYQVVSPTEPGGLYQLSESVLVKNNSYGRSDLHIIDAYIKSLVNILTTQDTNLDTMKTPFMIYGNEKVKSSLIEQYQQIQYGSKYVVLDSKLANDDENKIEVFNTQTPDNLASLQDHYNSRKSDLLTVLGVNNLSIDKKERMITSEANANNQEIAANLATRLGEREFACERAKEVLKRDISVRLTDEFKRGQEEMVNGIDRMERNFMGT